MTSRISRRTVLRGLGVTMALPWLDVMSPLASRAMGATFGVDPPAPAAPPVRLAFVFMPNGVNYDAGEVGAGSDGRYAQSEPPELHTA